MNWDTAWEVEAKIDSLGWTAEFAIPFRSVSFDHESNMIHASGCIVNNPIGKPSNYRSELYFEDWLIKNKKVCITGIDTRTLTRKIRKQGVFKALIHKFDHEEFSIPILKKKIQSLSPMKDLDLASSVSTNKIYQWKNNNKKLLTNENEILGNFIAVIDFGVKRNILNILEGLGYKIIVFPISCVAINEHELILAKSMIFIPPIW